MKHLKFQFALQLTTVNSVLIKIVNLTFAGLSVSTVLLTAPAGGGGAGAFFFLRLNDIPSVDDDSDDVDPLKLCPGELWFDMERGDGSGVVECLQYLYFSMISSAHFHSSLETETMDTEFPSIA